MHSTRAFLITIDTEPDNLWTKPRTATTRNATFLPRFQALCERYGFAPTWLVDHVMARDRGFVEFGRDVIARRTGEIGVHPHAWNTPPLSPLTADDVACMPYLIEFPESTIRAKLSTLTDLLAATFDIRIVSHRAGRWALDGRYAVALAECGFRVDCSVTPGVNWSRTMGRPDGQGGSDYTRESTAPSVLTRGPDGTPLWEVPVTIRPAGGRFGAWVRAALTEAPFAKRLWNRMYPEARWFRPRQGNRRAMQSLLRQVAQEPASYLEFMLHSSELMPGGSPNFPDARSIEALYADLEAVFDDARARGCVGMTLREYADQLDSSA